jgi:hypothetical protein
MNAAEATFATGIDLICLGFVQQRVFSKPAMHLLSWALRLLTCYVQGC